MGLRRSQRRKVYFFLDSQEDIQEYFRETSTPGHVVEMGIWDVLRRSHTAYNTCLSTSLPRSHCSFAKNCHVTGIFLGTGDAAGNKFKLKCMIPSSTQYTAPYFLSFSVWMSGCVHAHVGGGGTHEGSHRGQRSASVVNQLGLSALEFLRVSN